MRALEAGSEWNDVILDGGPGTTAYRDRTGLWKHSRAHEIRTVVGNPLWTNSLSFSFVRNPYERLRSLYTYTRQLLRQEGMRRHLARVGRYRGSKPPFSWGWVSAYLESRSFSEYIRNPRLLQDPVALPMYDYLTADGELIVDFVGRHESLDQDFGLVCEQIGLPRSVPRKHNTSEPSAPLSAYYAGDEDYEWVYEQYEQDFVRFEYDQSPTRSRVVSVSLDETDTENPTLHKAVRKL